MNEMVDKKQISLEWSMKEINIELFLIALLIPFLKYVLNFPAYIDFFYIFYGSHILLKRKSSLELMVGSLILFIITLFFIILNKKDLSEITITSVYYLLMVSLITELIQNLIKNKTKESEKFFGRNEEWEKEHTS